MLKGESTNFLHRCGNLDVFQTSASADHEFFNNLQGRWQLDTLQAPTFTKCGTPNRGYCRGDV
eukprot:scaffold16809_cov65-Cylindrotheca_fusiformis.AAC.1